MCVGEGGGVGRRGEKYLRQDFRGTFRQASFAVDNLGSFNNDATPRKTPSKKWIYIYPRV